MIKMSYIEPLLELEKKQYGFIQRLIEVYVQTSLNNIKELRIALENENYTIIKKNAHSLKSSSLSLGLQEVSEICYHIETEIKFLNKSTLIILIDKIDEKNKEGVHELRILAAKLEGHKV